MSIFFKCIRYLVVFFLLVGIVSFSTSCFFDDDSDDDEIRIYLVESTAGDDITGLYVVPNPQGEAGNWGNNIINNYEILQSYGWKMYKFSPGTYDIQVVHNGAGSPYKEYEARGENGQGIKFDLDGGLLFRTIFTFD